MHAGHGHSHSHTGNGSSSAHGASHGHSHGGAPSQPGGSGPDGRPLAIVLGLNAIFLVIEAVAGVITRSLALLSDAGHMVTDVAALALALFAVWFVRRKASRQYTYGYHRFEVLAALANALAMLTVTALIFIEAARRFQEPHPVLTGPMLGVAVAGLAVNLGSVAVLHRFGGSSLNERGAMLHLIGDALGSVGAIVAGLVMRFTGWYQADPLVSGLIGLLILRSTWTLLTETLHVLMEGVPGHLSVEAIRASMAEVPSVREVRDLHVWTLASGFVALSAHVVVCGGTDADPTADPDHVRRALKRALRDRFGITHSTLEMVRPGELPEMDAEEVARGCMEGANATLRAPHGHAH